MLPVSSQLAKKSGVVALVRIFSPQSESEVLVVTALLEAHAIPAFVHGRGIGSVLPGIQINGYNTQSIMVPEECVAEAAELLAQLEPAAADPRRTALPLRDKIRVVLEGILFGWFVPSSRAKGVDESYDV
jgi:hypothetical protein